MDELESKLLEIFKLNKFEFEKIQNAAINRIKQDKLDIYGLFFKDRTPEQWDKVKAILTNHFQRRLDVSFNKAGVRFKVIISFNEIPVIEPIVVEGKENENAQPSNERLNKSGKT